ncbi:MAG: PDZ domain-containing protein [Gammaproteobacteria bacterium]|nr:PDZ domain-containing protein [Gammaproteobacteria bacterium]
MKKLLALTVAAVLSVSGVAQELDEADMDARIDAARQRLDEAAKEYAELHRSAASQGFGVHYALAGERHDRAFLGVLISRSDENGIKIGGVTPGGGAAEAGVKAGDLMIAVDGVVLTGGDAPFVTLHEVLENAEEGQPLRLDLVRDGGVITIDVVPQEPGGMNFTRPFNIDLPAFMPSGPVVLGEHGVATRAVIGAPGMPGSRFFGGLRLVDVEATLGDYFGVDEGVLVLHAGGADAELQPGDILQSINDRAVNSAADAYQALAKLEEDGVATVLRQNGFETITVEPMLANHRYIRIHRSGHDGEHQEDVHVMLDAP